MLSFSLSACGKLPSSNKDGQNTSNIENSLESVEIIPSTDTGISSVEDTSEDKKTLINENTATDDAWKVINAELEEIIMRIEHVALYVNDLEKTKKIFMEYLGAKSNDGYHNQKTGFCSYFLTFDDGARIEIMHIPKLADLPKKLARTGYSHIAFSVGSMEKVDALTAELKADGYEVISGPRTTGDGYYESCIVAVEDNQIEITV